MTHSTPTAAPSTTPPPRGEGPGVGGRPTRRVPIHGAPLLGAPLLIALLLATPTLAQIIPTGSPTADILLTTAITEQRVFLTCSSLDATSHPLIVKGWLRDTQAAITTLKANNVPPEAIAAFTEAAKVENVLPAPDTPYSDVKALCDANPDWQATLAQLNFTLLELRLPEAFE
ncbi:hypothetical protein [Tabrizicola sp.]|uniref:hypothetical protein n=1 Tax=Tabrizicola sp. TaxID=2005166 RepID=UPI003F33A54D